jgi:glutathione synthase/RimK-type ligase-like ATP-grasp enzyme
LAERAARLGFVTYSGAAGLTEDDQLAAEALRRSGTRVDAIVWDDAAVPWEQYDALVLRSTWDYHKKSPSFITWLARIESAGVPLWNPVGLIRWNMDKTYLRTLAGKGVPVTPTEWLAMGAKSDLATILEKTGWDRAVVKPTLSATAFLTWVTSPAQAKNDQSKLNEMTQRGGVLVQRFEDSISDGEWSLVFFRGDWSHSVLKVPLVGDFRVQKEYGGSSVPAAAPDRVIETAKRVLAEVEFPWLYARVDLVDARDGVRLMELEMLEPDLFLRHSAGAADRFASAIYSVLPPAFSHAE